MNKKIASGILLLLAVVAFLCVYKQDSNRSLASEIDTELE